MKREILLSLYQKFFSEPANEILSLPDSGSNRKYFRISGNNHRCIGVYNADIAENRAFISFTNSFHSNGLNVPKHLISDESISYYLLEDLGDTSLLDLVTKLGFNNPDGKLVDHYKQVLKELIRFQVEMHEKLDYSVCFPSPKFDKQAILWDLNHFKYFFLKISGIAFDEQKLENDFHHFAGILEKVSSSYFMYRDFQSRNIMWYNEKFYFIDYQGGRSGALQYDPASLLFEAKTNIPFEIREELLEYYITELSGKVNINRGEFKKDYYNFVLIRVLQALGAYGLRGWVEKKALFLQSIPSAIRNLAWLIEQNKLPGETTELSRVLKVFTQTEKFTYPDFKPGNKLSIEVQSFSFRKPLPDDLSGNGGGFIFDCRGIENPGLVNELKGFTGKDPIIAKFFREKSEMHEYIKDVFSIVSRSILKYQERDFKHLQLNFGCTGGRHRSVYAAEIITSMIQEKFDVDVTLNHRELNGQN